MVALRLCCGCGSGCCFVVVLLWLSCCCVMVVLWLCSGFAMAVVRLWCGCFVVAVVDVDDGWFASGCRCVVLVVFLWLWLCCGCVCGCVVDVVVVFIVVSLNISDLFYLLSLMRALFTFNVARVQYLNCECSKGQCTLWWGLPQCKNL